MQYVKSRVKGSYSLRTKEKFLQKTKECAPFCVSWNLNSREGVDHGRHRGLDPRADVVKVQHALNSPSLHAPDDGLGLLPEESRGLGCARTRLERQWTRVRAQHVYIDTLKRDNTGQKWGGGAAGALGGGWGVDDGTAGRRNFYTLNHCSSSPLTATLHSEGFVHEWASQASNRVLHRTFFL